MPNDENSMVLPYADDDPDYVPADHHDEDAWWNELDKAIVDEERRNIIKRQLQECDKRIQEYEDAIQQCYNRKVWLWRRYISVGDEAYSENEFRKEFDFEKANI